MKFYGSSLHCKSCSLWSMELTFWKGTISFVILSRLFWHLIVLNLGQVDRRPAHLRLSWMAIQQGGGMHGNAIDPHEMWHPSKKYEVLGSGWDGVDCRSKSCWARPRACESCENSTRLLCGYTDPGDDLSLSILSYYILLTATFHQSQIERLFRDLECLSV